jgi:hypothetical protein
VLKLEFKLQASSFKIEACMSTVVYAARYESSIFMFLPDQITSMDSNVVSKDGNFWKEKGSITG